MSLDLSTLKGYSESFIRKDLAVPIPALNQDQVADLAPVKNSDIPVLHYQHFSLLLSKTRKFPYFTATNIDADKFKKIPRKQIFDSGRDQWRTDPRARKYQWGSALYRAKKSDFHKGHLTKREDPQWGRSRETARIAAQTTFYYANAAPQIAELNSREWGSLEKYILAEAADPVIPRVCVFTGPVLDPGDPWFVTEVKGERLQIPELFWKVVYFTPDGVELRAVAFLMGQAELLRDREIVTESREVSKRSTLFMEFDDAATYQVSLKTIEALTDLHFPPAKNAYKDKRPMKLILEEVEVEEKARGLRDADTPDGLKLSFKGIKL